MGRTLPQPATAQPAGFHQEINTCMLEDMWRTLAAQAHPVEVLDRRLRPPTLKELFELLKDVTWDDFWKVFPYELREHGSYLDELDALALLLSSPVSKQRFQRYFEQYADVIVPSSDSSNGTAVQPRPLHLGLPLPVADGFTGHVLLQPQDQQHQQELPVRRRGQSDAGSQARQQQLGTINLANQLRQQQQAGGPVAYVSPAAPGRLLAAAHAHAAARQQQHRLVLSAALPAYALDAAVVATADVAPLPAGIAAAGSGAGTSAAAAAAAPQAVRLTGRRRSWHEACETDAQPTVQHTASPAVPAGSVLRAALPDNSRMWRAVHDTLTSDDEPLLTVVTRLVPYSFAGQLCSEQQTRKQLQILADSRPVPKHVVNSIADRLAVSSETQLLRLTAGSGYSKRALAAAAALICTSRTPFYIPLAGCYTAEDVEAAIMRGIFCDEHAQHVLRQQQQQEFEQGRQQQQQMQVQHPFQPDRQQLRTERAQQAAGGNQQQRLAQQQQEPNGAGTIGVGTADAMADADPAPAGGTAAGAQQEQQQPVQQQQEAAVPATAAAEQGGHLAPTTGDIQQILQRMAEQRQLLAELLADNFVMMREGSSDDEAHEEEQQQRQEQRHSTQTEQPGEQHTTAQEWHDWLRDVGHGVRAQEGFSDEDRQDDDDVSFGEGTDDEHGADDTDRCADQLSAHLTLLGACSKQPLLLILDETDSAMVPGSGKPFRSLLLRMLCQLPQVAIVVTDSFEPENFLEGNGGSVLRRQGPPVAYNLPDGVVRVGTYRLPRPLYYHCGHCY